MAESDDMQVDMKVETHQADTSHVDPTPQMTGNQQTFTNALLLLLRDSLHTFITLQITRALGEDMLSTFAPSATATELDLLYFIDKKWLSIFSDSPLSDQKHTIQRLLTLIKSTPSSTSACCEIARLVEAVLISIAPTRAARAADLRRAISSTPSKQSANASSSSAAPSSQPSTQRHASMQPTAPYARHAVTRHAVTRQPGNGLEESASEAYAHAHSTAGLVSAALAHAPVPTLTYALAANHAGGAKNSLPLPIVLDGSNIAWRHGKSSYFSMRGAVLALQFFLPRVSDVALFLPEARLEPQHRDADTGSYDEIHALKGSKHLVLTPPNDYDDAYMCSFARKHAAAIVSNDEFRDHVYQASADGERCKQEWTQWLQACRVSFTFCQDEFVPYPAFNWAKAANVATQLRFPSL